MRIRSFINRNNVSIGGEKAKKNYINLEWWHKKENIGDTLAKVVFEWMIENNNLDKNKKTKNTVHLMTIGSLIGMYDFDTVVWGSGIHCVDNVKKVYIQRKYRKYDIRAVRGPITASILKSAGYQVNDIYGDPAILMPYIYNNNLQKKYKVSMILHLSQKSLNNDISEKDIHLIDVETDNYKKFIDEILESELVISSSLHGIILAETYGVPAIFLKNGMENEIMKFFDWYLSTERNTIVMANSIEEALKMSPMPLPNLSKMQKNLLNSFPIDLWN